ncbi:TIGR03943 family putative permease subunit [Okibacterium endophyticum]
MRRWQGLLLSLVGIVATMWLAFSGQLGLYIHPRYTVFTTVMALIGGVLAIAAFAVVPTADDHNHHEHGPTAGRAPRRFRPVRSLGAIAIIVVAAFALLVLPPTTLTVATAQQRTVNGSSSSGSAPQIDTALTGADTSTFTVKDWSLYLQMGVSEDFLASNPVDVDGFVSPDPADPENVFYVARFSITCCAVDATPMGLAVYQPGWAERLDEGEWVNVTGTLGSSSSGTERYAIVPHEVTPIDEPAEPYVY